jgi:hypothetical protein
MQSAFLCQVMGMHTSRFLSFAKHCSARCLLAPDDTKQLALHSLQPDKPCHSCSQDPWCVESLAFQQWYNETSQPKPRQWFWQDAAVQDGTRRYCDDMNCYRMGLTASKPGSAVTLTIDTSAAVRRVAQQPRSFPAAVLDKAQLAVLYTQSPRGRMGIARLSCVANCACSAIEMDGITGDGDGSAALAAGRTEVS